MATSSILEPSHDSGRLSGSLVTEVENTNKLSLQMSVVVPMYNQGRTASVSLARIKEVLNSTLSNYEIVVVNDGSIDDTLQVLQKEQESDSRVKVISYVPNKGKGHAVKTGVLSSRGETVMFMDGDLDISPHVIKDYVAELETCDLVIASKNHPLSKVHVPFSRKFLSKVFNLFVMTAIGIRLRDTQSGLKAGNGKTLRTIFKVLLVKRYAFDVELLAVASALNLTIKELPVEITLTHKFKIREICNMLVDVLAVCYRYRVKHWYQKQLIRESFN